VLQDPGRTASAELRQNWRVLVASGMGTALGAASLPFYSFGTFVRPLESTFGWSRGQISTGFLFLSGTMAVMSPLLGFVIDHLGSRRAALLSIPAFALLLFGLSEMSGSLPIFYLCSAAIAVLGVGTTAIGYSRAVNMHFVAARGLALGISLCGSGIMAIVLPQIIVPVIADHGWQTAYRLLAVLAIVPLPLAYFLLPDRVEEQVRIAKLGSIDTPFLLTRPFLTLLVSFLLISVPITGIVVHLSPLLLDRGLPAHVVARMVALVGAGVLVGRIGVGYLIDRYFAPYVAAIVTLLSAIGCVSLMLGNVRWGGFTAISAGLSLGFDVDLLGYLVARYFGMSRYGLIYALLYASYATGAAIGPALAGYAFDLNHSYTTALLVAVAMLLVGAGGMLSLPRFGPAFEGIAPEVRGRRHYSQGA
jgi:MFS family permease